MKITHDKTKALILEICSALKAQAENAQQYKMNSDKVNADMLTSQIYKQEKIAELREAYDNSYYTTKETVMAKLAEIAPLETENEDTFELDVPEFTNTLNAINAAQGHLPSDVITGIIRNFAGQYQALLSIKAAFERYNIDLTPYNYEEFITRSAFALRNLEMLTKDIEYSEVSTIISLRKLHSAVIRFGEVRGMKFTDEEKNFATSEEMRTSLAHQVMGLN